MHAQVKGRQRSRNFGRERLSGGGMGAQKCPRRRGFLSAIGRLWTEIYEKFSFRGHLPPKPQTWRGSNRHLTQGRLQVKGCTAERYCSFRVVVQGPGSFQSTVNFSLWHTITELRGVKVAQFSDFGLFSQYQTPKTYFPVTSLQPRGYIAEWLRFYRATRMHNADYAVARCLSHAGILSKRLYISSNFFSPSGSFTILFSHTKRDGNIPTGTLPKGDAECKRGMKKSRFSTNI